MIPGLEGVGGFEKWAFLGAVPVGFGVELARLVVGHG